MKKEVFSKEEVLKLINFWAMATITEKDLKKHLKKTRVYKLTKKELENLPDGSQDQCQQELDKITSYSDEKLVQEYHNQCFYFATSLSGTLYPHIVSEYLKKEIKKRGIELDGE